MKNDLSEEYSKFPDTENSCPCTCGGEFVIFAFYDISEYADSDPLRLDNEEDYRYAVKYLGCFSPPDFWYLNPSLNLQDRHKISDHLFSRTRNKHYRECLHDGILRTFAYAYHGGFECIYRDPDGNELINAKVPHRQQTMDYFHEGLAAVCTLDAHGNPEKHGYMDRHGTKVIPMQWDYAGPFHNALPILSERPAYSPCDRHHVYGLWRP